MPPGPGIMPSLKGSVLSILKKTCARKVVPPIARRLMPVPEITWFALSDMDA